MTEDIRANKLMHGVKLRKSWRNLELKRGKEARHQSRK
jgi:hypothetical protein